MTTQELEQINLLAAKSRLPGGLTDEEKAQQASLRKKYVEAMRASLLAQLDGAQVQNPDGSLSPLKKRASQKAASKKPQNKIKE
ncbi:MAG: DUF896 domain-containing protein [Ruthenibacterium sp.]